jgi:hypothetical protein
MAWMSRPEFGDLVLFCEQSIEEVASRVGGKHLAASHKVMQGC